MDGLKSKKAAKVHENHAWNCRLLRGQIELLKNSIDLATTQLIQIIECGIQYSMIQVCTRYYYGRYSIVENKILYKNRSLYKIGF